MSLSAARKPLLTLREKEFLYWNLKPGFRVLEYGSGNSTKEISARVSSLLSIEHDSAWAALIEASLPGNAELRLVPPRADFDYGALPAFRFITEWNEFVKKDGTYEQFREYIETVSENDGLFDLIIIDGRARIWCARHIAENRLLKPGGLMLVHDYHPVRSHFQKIEEWFEKISQVEKFGVFKLN